MKTSEGTFQGIWTLGEQRDGAISPVSYELLAWGRELADKRGTTLASVVLGSHVTDEVGSLIEHGADLVYVVDHPGLEHYAPDVHAAILEKLIREFLPETLIASATTYGRTIMPVLAAKVETGLTADCTGLDIDPGSGLLIQTRPAIGGNVMATIKTPDFRPQMSTVRPLSRKPLPVEHGRQGKIVTRSYPEELYTSKVKFLGFCKDETAAAPIQEAETVVCGGKGLKDAKGFALVQQLADLLGGSVGASRKAVDMGWASYAHQVGLSGKTVSPHLYVCAGVSGAVQHIAGMGSSDVVIAINNDPDAPIFKVCDLGITGDALEILPAVIGKLRAQKATGGR